MHYEKFPDGTVKCIEDEIPFELPDGWEWCRLSVYTAIMNGDRGKNYPSKDKLSKDNSGIPFISASDINNGYVVKDNMLYMSNKQFELLSAGKLKLGDIVFCIRGSLGKCGRFMFDNGAIASSLVIVRGFVDEESYLEYLYQYLLSPIIFDEIKKYDNGSAQPNLAAKDFMKFFVPVPPLAEQYRIVSKINELLSFVDIIESDKTDLQTTIQLTKSKILDLAIRGKLVPQDPNDEPASTLLERIRAKKEELIKQGKIKRDKKESAIYKGDDNSYYEVIGKDAENIDDDIPYDIPDGWAWCRIKDICQMNAGKSKHKDQIFPEPFNNCFPCYGGNGHRGYVDTYNYEGKYSIVGRQGALCGNVNTAEGKFYATEHAVVVTLFDKVNFEWSFFTLKTLNLNQYATGAAQPGLSVANIQNVFIPVPPLSEQKRIADKVSQLFSLLDSIAENIN